VALVYKHQTEPPQVWKLALSLGDRKHLGPKAILLAVILPHPHQVLRTYYECFDTMIILEDAGERSRHQRLAETNNIADYNTPALVQMVGSDLHRRLLEFKKSVAEIAGDTEFRQTGPRLLGKVIGHLNVNVIRRDRIGARPTGVDDLDKLLRNIDAEPVIPTVFEPPGKFITGIVVKNIYIEFALLRKSCQSQIAAA